MTANRTETAKLFSVSLPTIDRWASAGMPVLRRGKKGVASSFDLAVCVAWVRRRDAKRLAPLPQTHERQPRRSREELREILRSLWLGQDFMLPWHPGTPEVMGLVEYEKAIGLEHDKGEIIDWLQLGFPTLPPAPGEKVLRVPRRHAELWRLLFGGLIETVGGDGLRLELGREMRKLCGMPMPLCEDADDEPAEVAEP